MIRTTSGRRAEYRRQAALTVDVRALAPGAANEIESRATQLTGGPARFRALSEEEQEALTAQAVEEVIRRRRST